MISQTPKSFWTFRQYTRVKQCYMNFTSLAIPSLPSTIHKLATQPLPFTTNGSLWDISSWERGRCGKSSSGTVRCPTVLFLWNSLSVAAGGWGGRCTLHAELRTTSALPPNVELTPSLTPDLHNHPPSPHQINVIATAFNLVIFGPNSTNGGKVKNKRVETDC